ncbi:alpha-hydroxy-acid oxidizing protein [Acidovorax sp. JHL-9]|uniref:alpha-hydroxy-acid oxidizing protein n=1 Tax=Acidovorax sp. JHL-9 TaxID=1276756 RepID=UPI001EE2E2B1|nr:alpha-hydroxy-acid oxidizing protein [Acidovorax sp. JHL-9]
MGSTGFVSARCVFAGRPFNFALAAGGKEGVDTAISLLQDEIGRTMAHIGIAHPYEISNGRIRKRSV